MKRALICIALCCLALSAQAGGFGLPETDLQLTYMHSLNSGENQTCLTVSFEITKVASMPLNLDVLFAPDFESRERFPCHTRGECRPCFSVEG